jgi:group I intron endonuclease
MTGIYKITSPTGKIYIGQSVDIKGRKNNYKSLRCKGQAKLHSSLISHGWDKHIFEVVYELPKDVHQSVLNNFEIFYWSQFKEAGCEMLNLKEPGHNGRHSEESKKKLSQIQIGKTISEETKKRMSLSQSGRKHTEEAKLKIKQYFTGRPRKPETIEKMRKAATGVKMSEETKRKMSEAQKRRQELLRKNKSY